VFLSFEFLVDCSPNFGATGVKNRPFPFTRHIAYTTACCYRTSRVYQHSPLINIPLNGCTELYLYCFVTSRTSVFQHRDEGRIYSLYSGVTSREVCIHHTVTSRVGRLYLLHRRGTSLFVIQGRLIGSSLRHCGVPFQTYRLTSVFYRP